MVSHELRMPLTSVLGAGATLLNAAADLDPAEMRQFHRIIVDRADHMRVLIGDLLDVARIETGVLPVDPEPSDLRAMVEEAWSRFQGGDARQPPGGGSGRGPAPGGSRPAAHRPGAGQPARQRCRVLPRGVAHPGERAVREGVHVAVSVADRGRGIPAELLPELFRKFSRASGPGAGSRRRRVGPRARHLQGYRGGPRGPHPGRGATDPAWGARFTFTLPAVGAVRDSGSRSRRCRLAAHAPGPRPGRGRQPPGPALRPRRPHQGGLCARRHRRPRRRAPPPVGGEAPPGPARPGAAGGETASS